MVKFVTCYKASGSLWFLCSNINKGKYDWPTGEIEWYPPKQLFQVQKCVSQVIKFYFTKKWQKKIIIANFVINLICYCHFFQFTNFTSWFTHFWTWNSCYWGYHSNSPMGQLYLPSLILEQKNYNDSIAL